MRDVDNFAASGTLLATFDMTGVPSRNLQNAVSCVEIRTDLAPPARRPPCFSTYTQVFRVKHDRVKADRIAIHSHRMLVRSVQPPNPNRYASGFAVRNWAPAREIRVACKASHAPVGSRYLRIAGAYGEMVAYRQKCRVAQYGWVISRTLPVYLVIISQFIMVK
jgi:hypothetical protein